MKIGQYLEKLLRKVDDVSLTQAYGVFRRQRWM